MNNSILNKVFALFFDTVLTKIKKHFSDLNHEDCPPLGLCVHA